MRIGSLIISIVLTVVASLAQAQTTTTIYLTNGDSIVLYLEDIEYMFFSETNPPPITWVNIVMENGDTISIDESTIESGNYNIPLEPSNNTPNVLTQTVTILDSTRLAIRGRVISSGGSYVTHTGFCWSLDPLPTTLNDTVVAGEGFGIFRDTITGLTPYTTYYIRAYAINSSGISYGSEMTGVAVQPVYEPGEGVTDIQGTEYETVILGNQEWMAKNLNTTVFSNGTPIEHGFSQNDWNGQGSLYCQTLLYSTHPEYGRLYNWLVTADENHACPVEWHVPSSIEWHELFDFLGGTSVAGSLLKAMGTEEWLHNTDGTNESGFTALPGGIRQYTGGISYEFESTRAQWWMRSENTQGYHYVALNDNDPEVETGQVHHRTGLSIRCLKNRPPYISSSFSFSGSTPTGAYMNISQHDDGGAEIEETGFYYSTEPGVDETDFQAISPFGYGFMIQGLEPLQTYYIRDYATNAYGTVLGEEYSFTMPPDYPEIIIDPIVAISDTSVIVTATVTGNGGGSILARGFETYDFGWNTPAVDYPAIAAMGTWTDTLYGLDPNEPHIVWAYVENEVGEVGSDTLSFSTTIPVPDVETTSVSGIAIGYASVEGDIIETYNEPIELFGFCYGQNPNLDVTNSDTVIVGIGNWPQTEGFIQGLEPNSTYYVRAFAKNAIGYGYGDTISFNSHSGGVPGAGVTDYDGNEYQTVIINGREWMAENLRVSHFQDGTPLSSTLEQPWVQWLGDTVPVYTWYMEDSAAYEIPYGKIYKGAIFNWAQNVCPVGWSVPTESDWDNMLASIGPMSTAGFDLIDNGELYWDDVVESTTNATGFTALPGGHVESVTFNHNSMGDLAYFWSSTLLVPPSPNDFYYVYLFSSSGYVQKIEETTGQGNYIRCVKDQ